MAHYILLAALACLSGSLAIPFGGAIGGPFFGGPGIHGGAGGFHGKGGGYGSMPLKLTCAVNFTGGPHSAGGYGIVNAIAVTIEDSQGKGGHHPKPIFGFVGGLDGLHGNGGGLSATIDIFSAYGGDVSVAFTEKARPERGCYADDFGDFYTGDSGFGGHGHGGGLLGFGGLGGLGGLGAFGGGYGGGFGGLGGYGAVGGIGPYGGGGLLGYGGNIGLGVDPFLGGSLIFGGGHGHKGGRGRGYDDDPPVPGVIAKVSLGAGAVSEINIDNLAGFKSLADLAGRGVVVCPDDAIEGGYGYGRCEGGILACCALHYDMSDQSLSIGRPSYPPPPPPNYRPPPQEGYPGPPGPGYPGPPGPH